MTDTLRPIVRPPGNRVGERLGRGFSLSELEKADITVNEAKWMRIPIDRRRKTVNESNVGRLKEYLERIREILKTEAEKKIEKPKPKPKPKPKKKKPKPVKKPKKIEKPKEPVKKPAKKPAKKPPKEPVKKPVKKPAKKPPKKKPPKKKPPKEEPKTEDKISEKEIEAQAIEELTILKGLGTSIAKKLTDFGILSLEDLVNMDMDIIAEETGIPAEKLKKWAKEAKGYLK